MPALLCQQRPDRHSGGGQCRAIATCSTNTTVPIPAAPAVAATDVVAVTAGIVVRDMLAGETGTPGIFPGLRPAVCRLCIDTPSMPAIVNRHSCVVGPAIPRTTSAIVSRSTLATTEVANDVIRTSTCSPCRGAARPCQELPRPAQALPGAAEGRVERASGRKGGREGRMVACCTPRLSDYPSTLGIDEAQGVAGRRICRRRAGGGVYYQR